MSIRCSDENEDDEIFYCRITPVRGPRKIYSELFLIHISDLVTTIILWCPRFQIEYKWFSSFSIISITGNDIKISFNFEIEVCH